MIIKELLNDTSWVCSRCAVIVPTGQLCTCGANRTILLAESELRFLVEELESFILAQHKGHFKDNGDFVCSCGSTIFDPISTQGYMWNCGCGKVWIKQEPAKK
jgi:hypothetical protein